VKNWRIIVSGGAYTPPECTAFHLQAELADIPEGEPNKLTTSAISAQEGNVIITRSGSRYELGEPEHNGIRTLAEMVVKYPWTRLVNASEPKEDLIDRKLAEIKGE
jgi:hypothetical protein